MAPDVWRAARRALCSRGPRLFPSPSTVGWPARTWHWGSGCCRKTVSGSQLRKVRGGGGELFGTRRTLPHVALALCGILGYLLVRLMLMFSY